MKTTHPVTILRANSMIQRRRTLRAESLESRNLLAAGLTNPVSPLDVNGDLRVTPVDALQVINRLAIGNANTPVLGQFTDVNGDGATSALDALQVINALGRGQTNIQIDRPTAEAEFVSARTNLFSGNLGNESGTGIFASVNNGILEIESFSNGVSLRVSRSDDAGFIVESLSGSDPATPINGNSLSFLATSPSGVSVTSFGDGVRVELNGIDVDNDVNINFLGSQNELVVDAVSTGDDFLVLFGRSVGENSLEIRDSIFGDDLLVDSGVVGAGTAIERVAIGDDLRFRGGVVADDFTISDSVIEDEFSVRFGGGDDRLDLVDLTVRDQALLNLAGGDDELSIENLITVETLTVEVGGGEDRISASGLVSNRAAEFELGGGTNRVLLTNSDVSDDVLIRGDDGSDRITIEGLRVGNDLRLIAEGDDDVFGLADVSVVDDLRAEVSSGSGILAQASELVVEGEVRLQNVNLIDVSDQIAPLAFDIIASSGSGTPNGLTIPAPVLEPGDNPGNVFRFDGVTGNQLPFFAEEFSNGLQDPRDLVVRGSIESDSTTLFINTADFNNPGAIPGDGVIDIDGILEFDLAGNFIRQVTDFTAGDPVSGGGGVFGPTIDTSDDPAEVSFFLGSRAQGDILEINPTTGELIGPVAGTENVAFPRGFVFASDGSLFLGAGSNPATGEGDNAILRIDPVTGDQQVFFSSELTGIDFSPLDVILSADGSSIITSSESPFSPGVATPSQVLIIPIDFQSGDDVTILDPGFDTDGSPILVDPRGLGIGPDGLLYVSSAGNDSILRFDLETGDFIDVFATGEGLNAQALTFVPVTGIASPLQQHLELLVGARGT